MARDEESRTFTWFPDGGAKAKEEKRKRKSSTDTILKDAIMVQVLLCDDVDFSSMLRRHHH
jgi:hypothetical protein